MSEAAANAASSIVDEEELYQALILDRARTPRHGAALTCHDAEAVGDNPMCGDRLHLTLRRDATGRIEAAGFEARGCAISLAAADLMVDAITGRSAPEAHEIAAGFERMVRTGTVPDHASFRTLRALAGVHAYRSRMRCALLPWNALAHALPLTDAPKPLAEEHVDGQ